MPEKRQPTAPTAIATRAAVLTALIADVTLASTVLAGLVVGNAAAVAHAAPQPLQQPRGAEADDTYRRGLELAFRSLASGSDGAEDARTARLAALHVPAGTPPSPYLAPGPFEATFRGAVRLDLNDSFRFAVRGTGSVRLSIGGAVVLDRRRLPEGDEPSTTEAEVRLRKGLNPFELVYRSPGSGDASLRLSWSNDYLPEEPLPPNLLRHAGSAALERGRQRRADRDQVARAMCIRCHPAAGPPAGESPEPQPHMPEVADGAPALDGVGARLRADWIAEWLLEPRSLRPGARMPSLLSNEPGEARQQAADLAAWLIGLAGRQAGPGPAAGDQAAGRDARAAANGAPPARPTAEQVVLGRRVYATVGCVACHGDASSPPRSERAPRLVADRDRPLDLNRKWRQQALATWLTSGPAALGAPHPQVDPDEAAVLAAYLLHTEAAAEDARPSTADLPAGDPEQGKRLAEPLRCLACHSLRGSQPPPSATPLARLDLSQRVWTAAATASKESTHPRHDLTPAEESAIERALAADRASFERLVPAEYAERQLGSSGCLACHGRDGEPAAWTAPGASPGSGPEADDSVGDFFGDAPQGGGDGPDHAPPDLTWAGEKLRNDWLASYLGGRTDDRPRPHLVARMPAFPDHAAHLAAGLHHQHGLAASRPAGREDAADTADLAEIGRDLIQADRLGCRTCHAVGSEPALGGEGSVETVDLALARRRLRRPWFDRFLRDPARMLPGTKMPRFVDEYGYTSLFDVLDGEATRQFDAIWHFLGSLDGLPD